MLHVVSMHSCECARWILLEGIVLSPILLIGVATCIVYTPIDIGLSVVPGLVPPSGVRSSNTAFTNSQFRYNLNTGATFNISCSSTHTSDDFTVSFYKDGVVTSDGDLEDTTLTEIVPSTIQKFIQLEFLNFQPVHDGVYHCFASASDTDEELSSDLYLYGSGEDCRQIIEAVSMHCVLHVPVIVASYMLPVIRM